MKEEEMKEKTFTEGVEDFKEKEKDANNQKFFIRTTESR